MFVDTLLRDPAGALEEAAATRGASLATARALILVILACGSIFGAAIGLYRGGAQIAFAAVKLPVVLLLTAALCAPLLTALSRALGNAGHLRRDLLLLLASLALASLVIAACTPIFLLAHMLEASYHALILVVVAICALGGGVGLRLFLGGLHERSGRTLIALIMLGTMTLTGAQMAWTLRPYLVRPRTPETPLVRALEGSILDAVGTSLRSAGGDYDRAQAPLP